MIVNVLFYVFAAILVVTALGVITARNPVHCALFLVAAFMNSAVIWLLLEAEFLAVTLIVVYVGAVMVLWLFVLMMLDIDIARLRQGFTRYAPLGALIALIVVAQIGLVVYVKQLGLGTLATPVPKPEGYSNTQALGELLYTAVRLRVRDSAVILLLADRGGHHAHDAQTPGARRCRTSASRWPCAAKTACASSRWRRAKSHDHHHRPLPRSRGDPLQLERRRHLHQPQERDPAAHVHRAHAAGGELQLHRLLANARRHGGAGVRVLHSHGGSRGSRHRSGHPRGVVPQHP